MGVIEAIATIGTSFVLIALFCSLARGIDLLARLHRENGYKRQNGAEGRFRNQDSSHCSQRNGAFLGFLSQ